MLILAKRRKAGMMWFDTGCRKSVSGPDDHKAMQDYLATKGLKATKTYFREEFVFGNGKIDHSDWFWTYPVFLQGVFRGTISIAECTVPCPVLFSLEMAKKWQAQTDHANSNIYLKKYDVTIPFQNGTPYIDVLDIRDTTDYSRVPEAHWL